MWNFVKKLKLSAKLTATILILGLLPLVTASVFNSMAATSSLERQAFGQLESVRAIKKTQIENYFEQVRGQVESMAGDPFVVESMLGLANAFAAIPERVITTDEELAAFRSDFQRFFRTTFGEAYEREHGTAAEMPAFDDTTAANVLARKLYIVDNEYALGEKKQLDTAGDRSLYTRLHRRYHPYLRDFMERFGYTDILLVRPDDGTVVYSVLKGIDFASNLKTGAFRDSNIAAAWALALEGREAVVVDYQRYLPAFDNAAAYIAAPIYDRDNLAGVLIFGMPVQKIDAIMTESSGMGETGESFLVGKDGLMRSQSRSIDEDTILSRQVTSLAATKVAAGETGSDTISLEDGRSVLSAYTPLDIAGLDWGLIAQIDEAEIQSGIAPLITNALLIGIVSAIALLSCALLFARVLTKPINNAAEVAQRISAGKLDNQIEVDSDDEIGDMLKALSSMQDHLKEQLEKDQEFVRRMSRVTNALDNASSGMIVTNTENQVVFANDAVQDILRDQLPALRQLRNDLDPANLIGRPLGDLCFDERDRAAFEGLDGQHSEHRIRVGARIIDMTRNAVTDDNGSHLGTVVEWRCWTAETLVEEEINQLIEHAREGDLTHRVDLAGKDGFFRALGQGINDLLDICQNITQDMAVVLSAMAKGDLTRTIDSDYRGAFGKLRDDANGTIRRLTDIVRRIKSAADTVSTTSSGIQQSNTELQGMMEQQASSLAETARTMDAINERVLDNAKNASEANTLSSTLRENATSGISVVESAVQAMERIQEASQRINEITDVIDGLAFQTNLLALNASVEAARAGDAGKGFAVVASEVRSLATHSAQAAKDIRGLIEDSGSKVEEGTRHVNQSRGTLEVIIDDVRRVTDLVESIAAASQMQVASIGEVSSAVSHVDQLTQKNAGLVASASDASRSLGQQAAGLNEMTALFTLSTQAPQTAANDSAPRTTRRTA